jgi:hypothetical protein
MRKFITICAIVSVCSIIALPLTDTTALAQAGSTGGTIGKTDKSASGGDEPQGDKKAARRAAATKQEGSGCSRVIGKWQWILFNQGVVVTLKADHTSTATDNNSGAWTCTDRTVTIHWTSSTDTLVLSSDGKKMIGSNEIGTPIGGSRL